MCITKLMFFPGSPSGHAMVTSSVMFCLIIAVIKVIKPR